MSFPRLMILAACVFFAGCEVVKIDNSVVPVDSSSYHQPIINSYHNIHYSNPGYFPGGYHCNGGYYSMRGYRD